MAWPVTLTTFGEKLLLPVLTKEVFLGARKPLALPLCKPLSIFGVRVQLSETPGCLGCILLKKEVWQSRLGTEHWLLGRLG